MKAATTRRARRAFEHPPELCRAASLPRLLGAHAMAEQRGRSARIANAVNLVLFVAACVAFALGIHALGNQKDLHALYYLLLGGLALKAAVDMLRPRSAR